MEVKIDKDNINELFDGSEEGVCHSFFSWHYSEFLKACNIWIFQLSNSNFGSVFGLGKQSVGLYKPKHFLDGCLNAWLEGKVIVMIADILHHCYIIVLVLHYYSINVRNQHCSNITVKTYIHIYGYIQYNCNVNEYKISFSPSFSSFNCYLLTI